MTLTTEQIARAISGHQFADAYPYLADDVRWTMIGGDVITGKNAVVDACEASAGHLSEIETTFRRFRVFAGDQHVVVDAEAEYKAAEGEVSVVASCDIYDFADGLVTGITSYNIELTTTP